MIYYMQKNNNTIENTINNIAIKFFFFDNFLNLSIFELLVCEFHISFCYID